MNKLTVNRFALLLFLAAGIFLLAGCGETETLGDYFRTNQDAVVQLQERLDEAAGNGFKSQVSAEGNTLNIVLEYQTPLDAAGEEAIKPLLANNASQLQTDFHPSILELQEITGVGEVAVHLEYRDLEGKTLSESDFTYG